MQSIDVQSYFKENAPQIPNITIRSVNAVLRGGMSTMDDLSAKGDDELRRVRNIGDKCLGLVIAMRDKYRQERITNK